MVVYERLGLSIHSNRHEDDMVKVCVSFKSLFPSSLYSSNAILADSPGFSHYLQNPFYTSLHPANKASRQSIVSQINSKPP
jgi:hypothetical protein